MKKLLRENGLGLTLAKEVIALIEAAGRKAVALPGDIRDEALCQKLRRRLRRVKKV